MTPDSVRETVAKQGYFLSEAPVALARFTAVCAELGPIGHRTEIRVEPGATSYFRRKDMLPYHTDSPMARYVAWLCVAQQESGGEMRLKDTRPIFDAAPAAQRDALRRTKARFPKIDGMHEAGSLPVLDGDAERGWRLNYAPWLVETGSLSASCAPLMAALDEFPGPASVAIALRPGSLLVIDNRRMLHGRDALEGDERILLRFWIRD
ncbi:TauD/TfdA family dioxygenase [Methylocystis parvus]|uniref:TauD/TfdA family dioxygenase n=1 Tax=Methylocystis parvus TaxID=134 RepID=A0A6B8M6A3_9HYPH|nr:TauD/TfdA family dioxygenase [Methylocystis parvus]QGM98421.1 TauD/TfdA family dioxygenase [Methylocystis parvus]WBK01245.1 TauD/TfdA family dioxygenase [Methylocystis parvus OBBP]